MYQLQELRIKGLKNTYCTTFTLFFYLTKYTLNGHVNFRTQA